MSKIFQITPSAEDDDFNAVFENRRPFIYHNPTDTLFVGKGGTHPQLAYNIPDEYKNNWVRHQTDDEFTQGMYDFGGAVNYYPIQDDPSTYKPTTGYIPLSQSPDPEYQAAHSAIQQYHNQTSMDNNTTGGALQTPFSAVDDVNVEIIPTTEYVGYRKFIFDPAANKLYIWNVNGQDGSPTHMQMEYTLGYASFTAETRPCGYVLPNDKIAVNDRYGTPEDQQKACQVVQYELDHDLSTEVAGVPDPTKTASDDDYWNKRLLGNHFNVADPAYPVWSGRSFFYIPNEDKLIVGDAGYNHTAIRYQDKTDTNDYEGAIPGRIFTQGPHIYGVEVYASDTTHYEKTPEDYQHELRIHELVNEYIKSIDPDAQIYAYNFSDDNIGPVQSQPPAFASIVDSKTAMNDQVWYHSTRLDNEQSIRDNGLEPRGWPESHPDAGYQELIVFDPSILHIVDQVAHGWDDAPENPGGTTLDPQGQTTAKYTPKTDHKSSKTTPKTTLKTTLKSLRTLTSTVRQVYPSMVNSHALSLHTVDYPNKYAALAYTGLISNNTDTITPCVISLLADNNLGSLDKISNASPQHIVSQPDNRLEHRDSNSNDRNFIGKLPELIVPMTPHSYTSNDAPMLTTHSSTRTHPFAGETPPKLPIATTDPHIARPHPGSTLGNPLLNSEEHLFESDGIQDFLGLPKRNSAYDPNKIEEEKELLPDAEDIEDVANIHMEAYPFIWDLGNITWGTPGGGHNGIIYQHGDNFSMSYEDNRGFYKDEPDAWYAGRYWPKEGIVLTWDNTPTPEYVKDQIRDSWNEQHNASVFSAAKISEDFSVVTSGWTVGSEDPESVSTWEGENGDGVQSQNSARHHHQILGEFGDDDDAKIASKTSAISLVQCPGLGNNEYGKFVYDNNAQRLYYWSTNGNDGMPAHHWESYEQYAPDAWEHGMMPGHYENGMVTLLIIPDEVYPRPDYAQLGHDEYTKAQLQWQKGKEELDRQYSLMIEQALAKAPFDPNLVFKSDTLSKVARQRMRWIIDEKGQVYIGDDNTHMEMAYKLGITTKYGGYFQPDGSIEFVWIEGEDDLSDNQAGQILVAIYDKAQEEGLNPNGDVSYEKYYHGSSDNYDMRGTISGGTVHWDGLDPDETALYSSLNHHKLDLIVFNTSDLQGFSGTGSLNIDPNEPPNVIWPDPSAITHSVEGRPRHFVPTDYYKYVYDGAQNNLHIWPTDEDEWPHHIQMQYQYFPDTHYDTSVQGDYVDDTKGRTSPRLKFQHPLGATLTPYVQQAIQEHKQKTSADEAFSDNKMHWFENVIYNPDNGEILSGVDDHNAMMYSAHWGWEVPAVGAWIFESDDKPRKYYIIFSSVSIGETADPATKNEMIEKLDSDYYDRHGGLTEIPYESWMTDHQIDEVNNTRENNMYSAADELWLRWSWLASGQVISGQFPEHEELRESFGFTDDSEYGDGYELARGEWYDYQNGYVVAALFGEQVTAEVLAEHLKLALPPFEEIKWKKYNSIEKNFDSGTLKTSAADYPHKIQEVTGYDPQSYQMGTNRYPWTHIPSRNTTYVGGFDEHHTPMKYFLGLRQETTDGAIYPEEQENGFPAGVYEFPAINNPDRQPVSDQVLQDMSDKYSVPAFRYNLQTGKYVPAF